MSATSSIEWTEKTWNPVRGCSIVSPGCVNCYAMKQAHRFSGPGKPYEGLTKLSARSGPQWTGVVRTVESALLEPLSWKKPQRVFVNSMSDLFHEDVPDEFIDRVFAVMALAPRHTFQILTKRAERMRAYCSTLGKHHEVDRVSLAAKAIQAVGDGFMWTLGSGGWHLPNVWLGVSVEDQQRADERIPLLLQTPAAVRFLSCEPLLGPLNLREMAQCDDWHVDALDAPDPSCRLHWVIVGGESGSAARPMHPDWARSLRDQCRAASVPFFFKQWGEWAPGECGGFTPTRAERTATFFGGKWDFGSLTPRQSEELHRDDEPDLYRFGKKRSGRLIDGVAWNEFPAVQP